MKTINLVVVTTLLLHYSVFAQNLATNSTNTTNTVFVDQTLSINMANVVANYKKQLKKLLFKNINTAGDMVIIANIYEATNSMSNRRTYTFTPPPFKTEGLKPFEIERARQSYVNKTLRIHKALFIQNILNKCFSVSPNGRQTHVLSSIQVLAEIAQNDKTRRYSAFYLSDMIEDSSIRSMDFSNRRNTISNFKTAISAANKDKKIVENQFLVTGNCLQAYSEIGIILPKTQNELNKNPAFSILPKYWKTMFTSFGAPAPKYF